MGRFNKLTGDYDPAWEETAGNQIGKMQDMTGRDRFEIWLDPDGYLVGRPTVKLYDSGHGDDSKLREATGMTLAQFRNALNAPPTLGVSGSVVSLLSYETRGLFAFSASGTV